MWTKETSKPVAHAARALRVFGLIMIAYLTHFISKKIKRKQIMSKSSRVLEPIGLIDNAGGTQIRREVSDLLEAGIEMILLDLTNITFMDSSGLGALVAILQQVRKKEAHLYLCSINDQVQIILELTKMDKIFDVLTDRAAFDLAIQS